MVAESEDVFIGSLDNIALYYSVHLIIGNLHIITVRSKLAATISRSTCGPVVDLRRAVGIE